jgi:osmotically-inducible protein OsmY
MAEEIEVILPGTSSRTDADIARTAESILEWTTNWPKDHLKVIVENGWITISGILDFAYQKQLATNSVRHLIGVKGVSNQIVIKETLTSNIVKSDIEAVLKRRALKDSKEIKVSVEGGKVTLTGVVHS